MFLRPCAFLRRPDRRNAFRATRSRTARRAVDRGWASAIDEKLIVPTTRLIEHHSSSGLLMSDGDLRVQGHVRTTCLPELLAMRHLAGEQEGEQGPTRGVPPLVRRPTLISEELFYRVQAVLSGRVASTTPQQRAHPDFPLRAFVRCSSCGRGLTGSSSKSRSVQSPEVPLRECATGPGLQIALEFNRPPLVGPFDCDVEVADSKNLPATTTMCEVRLRRCAAAARHPSRFRRSLACRAEAHEMLGSPA